MKSEDNILGKGIEAIFQKTSHLKSGEAKTLELPNGTIRREGDELIIRLVLGEDDDIRGAVEELAAAAQSGMLDQLVDLVKIRKLTGDHIEMAMMAAHEKDFDSAIDEYKAALKLTESPDIRFNLALVYEDAGKLETAIKQYLKILKANPSHVPALNNIGRLFSKRGDIGEAMEYYHQALKADPRLTEKAGSGDLFAPRFKPIKLSFG
jgi:tetratricopeptide (TPR) repeat protein